MRSFHPTSNDARICATIGRNIRELSRRRTDLRALSDQRRARAAEALDEWNAARNQLQDAKNRAKQPRQASAENRNRRLEQLERAAELAQRLAEALLGDYTANARQREANYRLAQHLHKEAERRWREADQALLAQEQRYEQLGCGSALDRRFPGD